MENECDFGISRYQLMYFPLFRLHLEEMTSLLRVRESLYGFSFSLSLSSLYTKTFLFECQNLIGATMTSMSTTLFCLFIFYAPIFNGILCRWRTLLPLAHDVTQRTLFSPKKKWFIPTCLVHDLFIVYGVIMYRRRATTFSACAYVSKTFFLFSVVDVIFEKRRKKERKRENDDHIECVILKGYFTLYTSRCIMCTTSERVWDGMYRGRKDT